MIKEVKIYYKSKERPFYAIDFENELQVFLRKFGLKLWSSKFDFDGESRMLTFEREE